MSESPPPTSTAPGSPQDVSAGTSAFVAPLPSPGSSPRVVTVAAVNWSNVLEFTQIFRGFRLAINPAKVMIALIDERDPRSGACQLLRGGQTAEAAADDHHVVRLRHRYNLVRTFCAKAFSSCLVNSVSNPNTLTWNAATPFFTLSPRPNPGVSMK